MQQLNYPEFNFQLRLKDNREEVFDPVRRKFVALTPEEWVRQHLILYLVRFKDFPLSVIGVEKQLILNKQTKRFDLVVFSRNGNPLLLAECKAPGVDITEKVFDQAARYNMMLRAEYFLITNGLEHYPCRLDYINRQYIFIADVPHYSETGQATAEV